MTEDEIIYRLMQQILQDESWQTDDFRNADLRWVYERLRIQYRINPDGMEQQAELIARKLRTQ